MQCCVMVSLAPLPVIHSELLHCACPICGLHIDGAVVWHAPHIELRLTSWNLLHLVQYIHPINDMPKDGVLPCMSFDRSAAHVRLVLLIHRKWHKLDPERS